MHREDYIYTHNNGACIRPHRTTMLPHQYSLVVSLYKITTGSINFELDIKQFGGSSENLVTSYPCCMAKCHFFLRILVKGIPWIPLKIPLSIFQPRIHLKV